MPNQATRGQKRPRLVECWWYDFMFRSSASSCRPCSDLWTFILTGPSCTTTDSGTRDPTNSHFSFNFQPSINSQDTAVTSAHFWFYAGEGATGNSSAPLFIVTCTQRPLQAAEAPSKLSSDGWATYDLDQRVLVSVSEGPFLLQVHCAACQHLHTEPDKTPFLDIHVHSRGPVRSPRHAPVTVPWSPSAIYLLQRPSQERLEHGDCQRAEIEISFEELGWNSWIVDPKALTFYYCRGNCSAGDRTTTMLGISQCCAPVPGSMRSLKITTTSDGGYSFNCETLPNIMPEECTCIWTVRITVRFIPFIFHRL